MAEKVLEDQEYIMDHDEDEDDFFDDQDEEGVDEPSGQYVILDAASEVAITYAKELGLDGAKLRFELFERRVNALTDQMGLPFEDVLVSSNGAQGYNNLLLLLFPAFEPLLSTLTNKMYISQLETVFKQAVLLLMWEGIDKLVGSDKADQAANWARENGYRYHYPDTDVFPKSAFAQTASTELSIEGLLDTFAVYTLLKDGVDFNTTLAPKEEAEHEPEEKESEPEEEEFDEDEIDPEVITHTARVLAVYKDLYEVGFELQKPYGLVTKQGFIRLKSGRTFIKEVASLASLFSLLDNLTGNTITQQGLSNGKAQTSLRDIDMRSDVNYYPEFQLGNLLGILGKHKVDSWADLRRVVTPEIQRNIQNNVDAGRDIHHIVDSLTTSCVISEFDPKSSLRVRFYCGSERKFTRQIFEREYEKVRKSIFSGMGQLFHLDILPSGVVEFILVFDMSAFNGKPLFAYEAVKLLNARGRKPSLRDMILGQDTSGKILTTNLDTQQACVILIGAGQRSGKGVLTLNMLGTILSSGSPMIYLDGKPDMATVLWDLGKKSGSNPAVWDTQQENGNTLGTGAPQKFITENPQLFGVLMYMKVLQLMFVAATLQAKGETFLDNKRPFFIFDEALATQNTIADVWKDIVATAKSKTAEEGDVSWSRGIAEWAESLDSAFAGVINSQLPMSGISTVWLFQSMQPTTWDNYKVPAIGGGKPYSLLKNPIISRLSQKILGRGTSDSEYGLSNVRADKIIENRVMGEGGRHFAMTTAQKVASMESVKVFKPYLVLNSADVNSKAVTELRSNVPQNVWDLIAPDGNPDPGVGFEGFAQYLGEDAITNLSKGRDYLEAVMKRIGLMSQYSSIEEYIYDASLESFMKTGALASGVASSDQEEDYDYDTTLPDHILDEDSEAHTGSENQDHDQADFPDMPYDNDEQTDTFNNQDEGLLDQDDVGADLHQENPDSYYQPDRNPEIPIKPENNYDEPVIPHRNQSPNNQMHYSSVYDKKIDMPDNPFKQTDTPISSLNAIRFTSNFIMQEILRFSGDYSRIESFEVTDTGLVINDIAFRPKFDQQVIAGMPFDIRQQVQNGNIVELFHFDNLRKFPNLSTLRIDNTRLAEGRVRRELGVHPNKSWLTLYKRFRSLQDLYIGGVRITDEDSSDHYDNTEKEGYSLTERLRESLNVPLRAVSSSRMERVWKSPSVKIATRAVGWTAGAHLIVASSAFIGAWSIFLGGMVGLGAYREYKKRQGG